MKKTIRLRTYGLALFLGGMGCGSKNNTIPTQSLPNESQVDSSDSNAGTIAQGQGNQLDAETIIANSLNAMGGKEALMKLKTLEARDCSLDISPMGLKGTSTSIHKSPNAYKMSQELAGVGKTEAGYDGAVAWEMSTLTGSRIVDGDEKLAVVESADLLKDVNWKKYYNGAKSEGTVDLGANKALKVVFSRDVGKDVVRYYAPDTFYLLREEREDTTQMGVIKSEMNFEDYREVAGVLMAHQITVKAASATVVMTCPNIVANNDVSDDEFKVPDEIGKLKK